MQILKYSGNPIQQAVSTHVNVPMMSNEHHRTDQIQLPIRRVAQLSIASIYVGISLY